jgi:hypothetical protein
MWCRAESDVLDVKACLKNQEADIYLQCESCAAGRLVCRLSDWREVSKEKEMTLESGSNAVAERIVETKDATAGEATAGEPEMSPAVTDGTATDNAVALTKPCTRCPERGEQPLENFDVARHGKYGRAAICKECRKKQYREMGVAGGKSRQSKLRAEKQARADRVKAGLPACAQPVRDEQKSDASPAKEIAAPLPLLIVVDLTDYAMLHDEIKRIAVEEDRTPEAQVRYWLRRHLSLTASVCVDLEKGIGAPA